VKKNLGGIAAGKMKFLAFCVQWKNNTRGDVPSESWGRWP
jgi:hypothetical protein